MTSQHRYPNRNYRPSADEYDGARVIAAAHETNVNVVLRAFMRYLNRNPARMMRILAADIRSVTAETPKGRPRKGDTE